MTIELLGGVHLLIDRLFVVVAPPDAATSQLSGKHVTQKFDGIAGALGVRPRRDDGVAGRARSANA